MVHPDVDLVVPVYNEEHVLDRSIRMLVRHLQTVSFTWRITIVDNASTDGTARLARSLDEEFASVRALVLCRKGRGHALATAWRESDARVVAYMDVDLSTDLAALEPLVAPLLAGDAEVAIGSRLAPGSDVVRGPKRAMISRGYNLLLRLLLSVGFTDAQCGFKAVRRDAIATLLPLIENDRWFFDTELLVLAERAGLRIHEVPVRWTDDPDSRVRIVSTVAEDLAGTARLIWSLDFGRLDLSAVRMLAPAPGVPGGVRASGGPASGGSRASSTTARPPRARLMGQMLRFSVVGVFSTLLFSVLYFVFAHVLDEQLANFLALALSAVANTAANRAFTFGVRGRRRATSHHVQGLLLFLVSWIITAAALAGLHAMTAAPSVWLEVIVLTAANLFGTVLRFVVLRLWVFRSATAEQAQPQQAGPAAAAGGGVTRLPVADAP